MQKLILLNVTLYLYCWSQLAGAAAVPKCTLHNQIHCHMVAADPQLPACFMRFEVTFKNQVEVAILVLRDLLI